MKRVTEIMTPEKARELLAGQTINDKRVQAIKDKINSGKWIEDNGFFIIVRKGKVMSGNHRLQAIIDLNIELRMRVQYE